MKPRCRVAVPTIEADPNVAFTVTSDYAFIPGLWRAKPGTEPTDGVPPSYHAAVQFTCQATIIDEAEAGPSCCAVRWPTSSLAATTLSSTPISRSALRRDHPPNNGDHGRDDANRHPRRYEGNSCPPGDLPWAYPAAHSPTATAAPWHSPSPRPGR